MFYVFLGLLQCYELFITIEQTKFNKRILMEKSLALIHSYYDINSYKFALFYILSHKGSRNTTTEDGSSQSPNPKDNTNEKREPKLGSFILNTEGLVKVTRSRTYHHNHEAGNQLIFSYEAITNLLIKQVGTTTVVEISYNNNNNNSWCLGSNEGIGNGPGSILVIASHAVIHHFIAILNGYHNYNIKPASQLIQQSFET
eukprot:Awhi_evm1s8360